MDDLELDRELRAALDVAPSPEFVARVRVAIAEGSNMRVVPRWVAPAAAAAGISLAVAMFVAGPQQTAVDTPARVANTATMGALPPSTGSRSELQPMTFASRPVVHAPPRRSRAVSAFVTDRPPVPEVLVSDADKRAFEDFVSTIHQRQFAAAFENVPDSTPWMVTELTLAPLTIEPLDSGTPHSPLAHN